MKKVSLAVWEDFEERVAVLSRERAKRKQATGDYISEYLYRGQSDSSWRLETTLERYTGRLLPLEEYYQIVSAMKPQIETYTGARWEIPSPQEYAKRLSADGRLSPGTMPEYEYLIYLRHHGFPSPLLDWSASPYVAAYFAFRNVSSKAASVSVYVYCEYTRGVKHGSSAKARISGFGPNV